MHTKLKYPILLAVLISFAIAGCERVVELKLNNASPQIVIEGNVTNQSAIQTVKISLSVPFTDSNNFPPVSGAIVTLADDRGNTYSLTESTTPGTYSSIRFAGRVGFKYTLTVKINDQTYTGSSVMPAPVRMDEISYKDDLFDDKKKMITVHYQDPLNVANQYQFVMFIDNVQIKNTIFATDDNFSNGRYVDQDLFQSDNDIVAGQTVTIEAQSVDRPMFIYLFSLSQQLGGGPAPTPSNPPSNLSNNALGYFSAHTTQRLSILIN